MDEANKRRKTMTRKADLDALNAQLNRLRADLAKVADATEKLVRNAGEDALESGEEMWESAKERVERHIEEQPLKTAAIAMGIGVVLGMLFSRR